MLGLGSGIIKVASKLENLGIVTEGLVLKHNYAVSAVQPIGSGAASFNGTSDYIAVNAKPVDTADATYCWWSSSTQATYQTIFTHGAATTGAFHANFGGTGRPLLYLHNNLYQYWDPTDLTDDGLWHHWALVVDVSSMSSCKLYCDGVEMTPYVRETTGSIIAYGDMVIGVESSNEFDGYMCNFGVWSSHLSQPQIKSIMQKDYAGLSDSEKTDLVSWWNLDSAIGGTSAVYDNHHGSGGEVISGELIINSGFPVDNDPAWNHSSGWSTLGGKAIYDGTGGTSSITQDDVIEENKTYKVSIDVLANEGSGANTVFIGGNQISSAHLEVGTHTFIGSTTNTNVKIYVYGRSGEVFEIDSISVKEVNASSAGDILGDEAVVNGDFTSGSTGWSVGNTDANNYFVFDNSTVRLKLLNTSPISTLNNSLALLSGKTYELNVDIASVTSGGVKIDAAGMSELFNSAGTTKRILKPTANTSLSFYRATGDVDITLNSVSVKLINGNTGTLS